MSGPWEKYQKQAPQKPWEKYAKQPDEQEKPSEIQAMGGIGAKEHLLQGLTFNTADNILSGAMTPVELAKGYFNGEDEGKGFGERVSDAYDRTAEPYNAGLKKYEREHPKSAMAALLLGSLGTGAGLAKAGVTASKMIPAGARGMSKTTARVGASVADGAAMSAAYAAGDGGDVTGDALVGGAMGVAAPVAGKVFQSLWNSRLAKKTTNAFLDKAPSIDELKAKAGNLYDAGKARGQIASPAEMGNLAKRTQQTLVDEGVALPNGSLISRDPDMSRVSKLLNAIQSHGLQGKHVKPVREVFTDAAKDPKGANARIGKILKSQYDDFVHSKAPEFREADGLYARAKRAEVVDDLVARADINDTSKALQNQFKSFSRAQLKGKHPGYAEHELDAMQGIAMGGSKREKALRWAGSMAPSSAPASVFTTGIPAIAGTVFGGPLGGGLAGIGPPVLGYLAKRSANKMQDQSARMVQAMITSGKQPQAPPKLDALRRLMLERSMSAAGSQAVNTMPKPRIR